MIKAIIYLKEGKRPVFKREVLLPKDPCVGSVIGTCATKSNSSISFWVVVDEERPLWDGSSTAEYQVRLHQEFRKSTEQIFDLIKISTAWKEVDVVGIEMEI